MQSVSIGPPSEAAISTAKSKTEKCRDPIWVRCSRRRASRVSFRRRPGRRCGNILLNALASAVMGLKRGLPVLSVAGFAFVTFLLREMVSSVLRDRASLNVVGVGAVLLLTGLAIAALVFSNRARSSEPPFRGTLSELIRIAAVASVALVAGLWVMTFKKWIWY